MRTRPLCYILQDGQPVPTDDPDVYGPFLGAIDERRLALSHPAPGVQVSTVFVVFDHSFSDGPPVLWETMVFAGDSPFDGECQRYTSREAALAGHWRLCGEIAREVES